MSSFDRGQGTVYALSWQRPLQMLPMIACIPLPEACPITLPYPPRGARRARVHQQIAGRNAPAGGRRVEGSLFAPA